MPIGINRLLFMLIICLLAAGSLHSQSDRSEETIHQRYLRALELISAYQFERAQEILSACYLKIALQYFEQYLATKHDKFRAYSEQRSRQLREYLHSQQ